MTGHRHLLIDGAQRCGSTWLRDLVGAAPGVRLSVPVDPEPKYLLRPDADRADYLARFFADLRPGDLTVDKSTSYLATSGCAPRAARIVPEALVVAQLRDPVARAVSHWGLSTRHGFEDRPVAEALADCLAPRSSPSTWDRAAVSVDPRDYLTPGRYAEQLLPWLDAFPGRVHVQCLEEAGDPDWLPRLGSFLRVTAPLAATARPAPAAPVDLPAALVADLRAYFRAPDAQLAALLGHPLPWVSA